MRVAVDNGERAAIPGLAASAGVRLRAEADGDVAVVSVRGDQLLRPMPAPGATLEFCGGSWVLESPAPATRDSTTFTFRFRRA